ncbi:MAG: ChbG/HpnK family deacetylase, partial [Terriglobales bacterium]
VSHVDTHKHTHVFPSVYRPLLRAAREAGVRAVRNPFAPVRPLAFAHLARRPRLWTRYSEFRLLRHYSEAFLRQVQELDMVTSEGTFGAVVTGMLDPALFQAILGSMPEGPWELVCHPGYNDDELGGVRTRLRESREVERRMLASPETKRLLAEFGVELISYHDLANPRAAAGGN